MASQIERNYTPESKLDRVIVEQIPVIHKDERRQVVEFYDQREPAFRNATVIEVKQPQSEEGFQLGNHYHQDAELFYLASGEIDLLVLADVETDERRSFTNLQAGTKIFLPSRVAHLFIFKKQATLLAFNENPFNPENLIPYKLS